MRIELFIQEMLYKDKLRAIYKDIEYDNDYHGNFTWDCGNYNELTDDMKNRILHAEYRKHDCNKYILQFIKDTQERHQNLYYVIDK